MAVPKFDFTDRAKPVVQMGRSVNRLLGNDKWGRAQWGVGKWGARDWEPVWTDLTCEVHEITTDTGRGGATDRFRPGTAEIVASNVSGLSELIFPPVPAAPYEIELVPQPPIGHEEDLQAPGATTIISNGWSFTDDFERAPPRWIFPPAWAGFGPFPTTPFRYIDNSYQPELYHDDTLSTSGSPAVRGRSALQWTRPYPQAGTTNIVELVVDHLRFPEPAAGAPGAVVELYVNMSATTLECYCGRVTFTPVYGGANEVTVNMIRRDAAGGDAAESGDETSTFGTGSDGVFPPMRLRLTVSAADFTNLSVTVNGESNGWTPDAPVAGNRIGFAVQYEQGRLGSEAAPGPPQVIGIVGSDFEDDVTRPLGSGWVLPPMYRREFGYTPMHVDNGAMVPSETVDVYSTGVQYNGFSAAQFTPSFVGDQFAEVEITGMSAPVRTETRDHSLLLLCHANNRNLAAMSADIRYVGGYGSIESFISYHVWQVHPFGDTTDVSDSSGTIVVGPSDGMFDEPDRWRFESDTVGAQRLYRNGVLLVDVMFPDPAVGDRVGVAIGESSGEPETAGEVRGRMTRIEEFSGGLREPLGTEEIGTWVRIGIDHATLGLQWMFRGFVDAVVPTYIPDRPDAVRVECIDSLGEAGRVFVDGQQLSYRFQGAPHRIRQILDAAHWPAKLRAVHDDSTIISRPEASKAVDLLTHVAESCGGAVYGSPTSGEIVFKGQDWQGAQAAADAEAYITNANPDVDVPVVCPVGWERSSRRSDMTTRVRFSTEASDSDDFAPLLFEWRHPEAEHIYGVELYERTLLCITRERVQELARRQLVLRNPNQFPRIEAVLLDASTATEALDLMTTATFTKPSKYRCQLRRPDQGWVFNRGMLVTGVRHRMTPTRWTTRLALDPASVFAEFGARWGRAHWGRDVWGRTR